MIDIENIKNKLHIEQLSRMQKDSVDAILHSRKDVIILSPTGSGKTLAYLLPIIQLINTETDTLQVVVIVPGRELALQSSTVLQDMKCGVRSLSLYGGRPAMEEHRQIKKVNPHIVFATPGRLNDHIDKNNISVKAIKYVVLDEFDKCLEMGFQNEMNRLFARLKYIQRRILLSATRSEQIPDFVNMSQSVVIDYSKNEEQVPERISLNVVKSDEKDKLPCLVNLLRSFGSGSTIVFLNFRDSVERVALGLLEAGFIVSRFHGGMSQPDREMSLFLFSNGSTNILVSTDLGSRGLDIPEVDNIVHYHLPVNEEAYIHRVGRSARWAAKGNSFIILNGEEHLPEYLESAPDEYVLPQNLPTAILPKMTTVYIGKGKKDKVSKGDIVGFLCKKGGMPLDMIGKIEVRERYAYVAVNRKKVADMLRKIQNEKIKGMKTVVELLK